MLDITWFAVNTCKHQLYIPNAVRTDKICKTPRCTLVRRPVLKLTRSPNFMPLKTSSTVAKCIHLDKHDLAWHPMVPYPSNSVVYACAV